MSYFNQKNELYKNKINAKINFDKILNNPMNPEVRKIINKIYDNTMNILDYRIEKENLLEKKYRLQDNMEKDNFNKMDIEY